MNIYTMGIDGLQYLEIRGAPAILDRLEATGVVFEDGDMDIAAQFFGKGVQLQHRTPRHLVFTYEFRNQPVYEYLTQLLVAHPTLWIKNDYRTEDGDCGVWIGRIVNGIPAIQERTWRELMQEEIQYMEDFSQHY